MVGGAAEMRASNDDPTQEPMHGMLGRERNPAEHLKRTVRHFERGPRAVGLGDRRGAQAVGLVLVERCRGVEDARPGALDPDIHVGKQVAHGLEASDRLPELAALRGVVPGEVERRGCCTDRLCHAEDGAGRGNARNECTGVAVADNLMREGHVLEVHRRRPEPEHRGSMRAAPSHLRQ